MSPLLKLLYPILYLLALPWILYRLAVAGSLGSLTARLGFLAGEPLEASIWLHASSVGEVSLLAPLIAQFERAYPNEPIVISAYTETGLQTARKRYPAHRTFAFPFDFAFVIRRYLGLLQPKLVVIAESELWPQFLTVLAEHRIPIVIVNAKMSERSFRVHARTRFVAQALRGVESIAVQSEAHAGRLRALGVDAERVVVTGNMKYDLVALPRGRAPTARAGLGFCDDDIIVIGGSLHTGEDALLLEAVAALRKRDLAIGLILAPRYPQDASRVVEHAQAHGFSCRRKSALDAEVVRADRSDHVLVVDTLGELRELYRIADIAFVGGSMFFRGSNKGGHNLMEPAICGVPVLFGPYNFSFNDTAESLVAAEAGIEVDSASALRDTLAELAGDPARRRAMGDRARRLVLASQGASDRSFALIERALAGGRH